MDYGAMEKVMCSRVMGASRLDSPIIQQDLGEKFLQLWIENTYYDKLFCMSLSKQGQYECLSKSKPMAVQKKNLNVCLFLAWQCILTVTS